MNETTVPAKECVFQAEVEVKERKGDGDRSTPFRAIARTGDALNHAYWGKVVHDLDGMRVKSRVPIDFNHNPNEIVGYANRFNTEEGDLEIRGALTPSEFDEIKRAQEIIDKAEQGVPWEMSISFPGDLEVEQIEEGDQVTVNQRQFTGPLTVIRSWPLRAVAITPMGQDAQTALQFSEDQTVNVTYVNSGDAEMPKTELSAIEAEVEIKVEADAVDESENDTVEAENKVEAVDTEKVEEEPQEEVAALSQPSAQDYMTRFGRVQGALYFADGLSLDEATAKELERLQMENAELRSNKRSDEGEEEPTSFSQGGEVESNLLTEIPGERVEEVIRKG